eukprot:Rhum_TRINITY_DN15142_c4_g1::Rhum_TRINITY_DN15142_c4_g1_i1::g.138113::m.138113
MVATTACVVFVWANLPLAKVTPLAVRDAKVGVSEARRQVCVRLKRGLHCGMHFLRLPSDQLAFGHPCKPHFDGLPSPLGFLLPRSRPPLLRTSKLHPADNLLRLAVGNDVVPEVTHERLLVTADGTRRVRRHERRGVLRVCSEVLCQHFDKRVSCVAEQGHTVVLDLRHHRLRHPCLRRACFLQLTVDTVPANLVQLALVQHDGRRRRHEAAKPARLLQLLQDVKVVEPVQRVREGHHAHIRHVLRGPPLEFHRSVGVPHGRGSRRGRHASTEESRQLLVERSAQGPLCGVADVGVDAAKDAAGLVQRRPGVGKQDAAGEAERARSRVLRVQHQVAHQVSGATQLAVRPRRLFEVPSPLHHGADCLLKEQRALSGLTVGHKVVPGQPRRHEKVPCNRRCLHGPHGLRHTAFGAHAERDAEAAPRLPATQGRAVEFADRPQPRRLVHGANVHQLLA